MTCRAGHDHETIKADPKLWQSLPSDGIQPVEAGPDPEAEPAYRVDLRRCACGSTIGIELA